MVGPLAKGLNVSLSQASLGLTFYFVTLAFANPIVAVILHYLGARITMTIGAALYVVVGLLMGFVVNSLVSYYITIGLVMGFACSMCAPVPLMTNVSYWFVRNRATAMGIALTGGGVGAMIFAPVMGSITATSLSWQTPWLYVSLFAGIGGVIVAILLKNKPEEMGLFPDGKRPGEDAEKAIESKNTRVYKTTDSWETRTALKSPIFYLITTGAITVIYSSAAVIGMAVTYFTGLGIPKVLAAGAIGMFGVISVCGRLGAGILCDLYEPRYVAVAGFICQAAAMVVMIMAGDVFMIYLFTALYGIAFGLTYVCVGNIVVNYFGVKSYAAINSIVWTIAMALGATAPFITGAIVDVTGSFFHAWIVVLILAGLSSICYLFAVPPKKMKAS
jgi:MFS family permease